MLVKLVFGLSIITLNLFAIPNYDDDDNSDNYNDGYQAEGSVKTIRIFNDTGENIDVAFRRRGGSQVKGRSWIRDGQYKSFKRDYETHVDHMTDDTPLVVEIQRRSDHKILGYAVLKYEQTDSSKYPSFRVVKDNFTHKEPDLRKTETIVRYRAVDKVNLRNAAPKYKLAFRDGSSANGQDISSVVISNLPSVNGPLVAIEMPYDNGFNDIGYAITGIEVYDNEQTIVYGNLRAKHRDAFTIIINAKEYNDDGDRVTYIKLRLRYKVNHLSNPYLDTGVNGEHWRWTYEGKGSRIDYRYYSANGRGTSVINPESGSSIDKSSP